MLAISYMGTKRPLAPLVAELASDCRPGACLDLFSGMCAVGQKLSTTRQIWSNDLQSFASLVAKCQFCSSNNPPSPRYTDQIIGTNFRERLEKLLRDLSSEINEERDAISSYDWAYFSREFERRIFLANRLQRGAGERYRLFLQRYAGTYFGKLQCVEIDSIRFALDQSEIDTNFMDWCLIALCSAVSRCANTTGHFAQSLAPKQSNIQKLVNQRKRSVWDEFLRALDRLTTFGSKKWRSYNRVFQYDALSLLRKKDQLKDVGVVYADPPYTSDQYSRFYHIYETLILYDYPAARGRGLYRDGRAVSSFSHATKVKASIDRLILSTFELGADLILSYPSNGLLKNSRQKIMESIKRHYGREPDVVPLFHSHSTMGASKGSAAQQVVEILYKARIGNVSI